MTEQQQVETAELLDQIEAQAKLITALQARIADLEERLGRTPRDSSMPPSAEGLSKPVVPNRAQRRADKRRQGKQPGFRLLFEGGVWLPGEILTT